MHIAILLSCILASFFCLASTGNAAPDDQDRQKLQDLLRRSKQTNDPNAQVGITYETVQIYKKYRGLGKSDNAIETELDTKVDEFESKIVLVEGVPQQGVGFTDFFSSSWIPGNVRTDAVNLAKSSSKALVDGIAKYILNKFWSIIGLSEEEIFQHSQ